MRTRLTHNHLTLVLLGPALAIWFLLCFWGLTVAHANPAVSFTIPIGTGPGEIAYVRDQTEPWGPISFCVLDNGNVAVLDAGDKRIQVFDMRGSFQYSVDIRAASISPLDIRSWQGGFALLEANSSPNSVVTLDKGGTISRRIDLPENLADVSRALRIGREGELLALESSTWTHRLTGPNGAPIPVASMAQRQTDVALQYGKAFVLSGSGPL